MRTTTDNNLHVVVRKLTPNKNLPLRVVITEATTYVSRSLAYRILSDEVFGFDQEIILSLFDTNENAVFLESTAIEITACAPNLLKDIVYSTDPSVAFKDADVVFSIGKARDYILSNFDLRSDPFFKDSILENRNDAYAIENYAKRSAKVITLGNTAAKIISKYAPSIDKRNITAVSLGLQKFAASLVAKKTDRVPSDVKNLIIWGSNSQHAFPCCKYATFNDGKSVVDEINDDKWFKKVLPKQLEAIFRRCRYRISEALALADHCKILIQGTPEGEWTSMSVYSDGSYGVEPEVFFSFPCICRNGEWQIVKGLFLDQHCKTVIRDILITVDEKINAALKICQQRNVNKSLSRKSIRKSIIKFKT